MEKSLRIKRIVLLGAATVVVAAVVARLWIARFESDGASLGGTSGAVGIEFLDNAQTNTNQVPDLSGITFLDLDGNQVALADYRDKKNVVLVFTRGYPGYLCLFCMTQTSRLITNYDQFKDLDAEVLVVFPGNRQDVQKLIRESKSKAHSEQVPFPILLDEEFRAVDAFGIRGNLAKPATYIFDKQGGLRFAYVGETISDRPSIKALLKQLEFIAQ